MSEKFTALYNKIEILYELRGNKYYIVRNDWVKSCIPEKGIMRESVSYENIISR